MDHPADPGLGATPPVSEQHIAETMKTQAQIMKQTRLSREESEALAKKRGGPGKEQEKLTAKEKAEAKKKKKKKKIAEEG